MVYTDWVLNSTQSVCIYTPLGSRAYAGGGGRIPNGSNECFELPVSTAPSFANDPSSHSCGGGKQRFIQPSTCLNYSLYVSSMPPKTTSKSNTPDEPTVDNVASREALARLKDAPESAPAPQADPKAAANLNSSGGDQQAPAMPPTSPFVPDGDSGGNGGVPCALCTDH